MTVRRSGTGAVVLDGVCTVEDAEPLLQMLQATPAAVVDWRPCRRLHTAVFQVLLASGIAPIGPCGDAWVAQWLERTDGLATQSRRSQGTTRLPDHLP